MKLKYQAPKITVKKIKISFFLSKYTQINPFQTVAELYADTSEGGPSDCTAYLPDIGNSKTIKIG